MTARTNKDRVLNIGKKTRESDHINNRSDFTHVTLMACAKTFNPNYELTMPIPSRSMEINTNNSGTNSTLYISNKVYDKIYQLSLIQYEVDKMISNSSKQPQNITFYATGYVLNSGDYQITDIQVPALDFIHANNKSIFNIAQDLITKKIPHAFHIESSSPMIDYLRTTQIPEDRKDVKKLFALYGTTKSRLHNLDTNYQFNNCFTLKEVANSIVPEIPIINEISSGALIIPPAIETYLPNEYGVKKFARAKLNSLECLVTDYEKHPKNNNVKPLFLEQITQCKILDSNINVKIGQTNQPYCIDEYVK